MDIRPIIIFIISGLTLFLGFYILSKNPKAELNRAFLVTALGVTLWTVSNGVVAFLEREANILFFYKLTYVGGAIIIGAFLWFAIAFPFRLSNPGWKTWTTIIGVPVILSILSLATDLIINGVRGSNFFLDTTSGPLYWLYVAFFLVFFGRAFYLLIKKLLRADGIHFWQLKYVLLSVAVPFVIATITDIIMPWIGYDRSGWTWYAGSLSTSVWVALTSFILFRRYR